MDLNGKIMLITGASSGIGAATARAAARAGAKVVLLARTSRSWRTSLIPFAKTVARPTFIPSI